MKLLSLAMLGSALGMFALSNSARDLNRSLESSSKLFQSQSNSKSKPNKVSQAKRRKYKRQGRL